MLQISVDQLRLDAILDAAKGFSERRMAAACATALTRTAYKAKDDVRKAMEAQLDRPTPYTLKGLFVQAATAQRVQAKLWFAGDSTGSQTAQGKYLGQQVEGGQRIPKKWEKALQGKGLMPQGTVAVPTRFPPRDAYGNVPQSYLKTVMSKAVHYGTATDRKTVRKVGGMILAIPQRMGKLQPGLFMLEMRDFGKMGLGRSGALIPLFLYKQAATYRPRFKFYEAAQQSMQQNLLNELEKAVGEHIAKLQAKGKA